MLIAYTDGSTHKANPGPMSWAVVYVRDGVIVQREVGALHHGTNNKAELLAVIWALERYSGLIVDGDVSHEDMIIRTDSILTLNIATGVWRAKSNVELWERFERAMERREKRGLATQFQHVKGHGTDPFNREADKLARQAALDASLCLAETRFPE